MIGYSYTRKPLTGDRSKQIARNHPSNQENTAKEEVKMPDKFKLKWK